MDRIKLKIEAWRKKTWIPAFAGMTADRVLTYQYWIYLCSPTYYLANPGDSFYLPYEWEVVDSDPNGLNCRCTDTEHFDGVDIYNLEVSYTLAKGERIRSTGINWDDRDLPWLWVSLPNEQRTCYVRANARYVRPIRSLRRR